MLLLPLVFALGTEQWVDYALAINLLGNRGWTVALLDPIAHGTLVLGALFPWVVRFRLKPIVLWTGLAASLLIDLDHFVAARSFSLTAAITLPEGRPFSHSLGFAILLGLVVGRLWRSRVLGSVIAAGISLHVLRDMATGAPWYWPLPLDWPQTAPYWLRTLIFTSVAVLGSGLPPSPQK